MRPTPPPQANQQPEPEQGVTFALPNGVEGEDGEEKDILVTIKFLGGGMASLEKVEGNPVSAQPTPEAPPTEDGDDDDPPFGEAAFNKWRDGQKNQPEEPPPA